jgi:hypothetical protein
MHRNKTQQHNLCKNAIFKNYTIVVRVNIKMLNVLINFFFTRFCFLLSMLVLFIALCKW